MHFEEAQQYIDDLKRCDDSKAAAVARFKETQRKRPSRDGIDPALLEEYVKTSKLGLCKKDFEGLITQEHESDRKRWQEIAASDKLQDFRQYVEAFPNGKFGSEAKGIIADLEACEFSKWSAGVISKKPESMPSKSASANAIDDLRKYLEQPQFTRCRAEIAALSAPPAALATTKLRLDRFATISDVQFAPGGAALLVASGQLQSVMRWDFATGQISALVTKIDTFSGKSRLIFSPDGRFLLEGQDSGIVIRDTQSFTSQRSIPGANASALAWSSRLASVKSAKAWW